MNGISPHLLDAVCLQIRNSYENDPTESVTIPVLVHDSILLKQIEDSALEEILKIYASWQKQIFIALDKGTSYTKESQEILSDNTILTLEPNGSELFGRAWNIADGSSNRK